jgi:hypothetical protein
MNKLIKADFYFRVFSLIFALSLIIPLGLFKYLSNISEADVFISFAIAIFITGLSVYLLVFRKK